MRRFSLSRWWGIVLKEFLQLRRDRITFGMVVGIPIVQLLLFGYAINTEPRHLPTAVVVAEQSEFTRSYLAAMKTSGYFRIVGELPDEEAGRAALEAAIAPWRREPFRWTEVAPTLEDVFIQLMSGATDNFQ